MYDVRVSATTEDLFRVSSEGYEFNIGNAEDAISPMATMLASLASCVGVYVKKYLHGAGIQYSEFEISAQADISEDKPHRFAAITVKLDLKNNSLDDRRKAALLRFVENCPVHNTLHAPPQVNISIGAGP